jgi:branched-chain amino acid transport system substrate-binding protein
MRALEERVNKVGGVAGRPVKFIVQDDQSSPQVALQLFNALLPQKPSIVLGPSLVAGCSAIAPLLANGPVVYCLSTGMYPPKGSYMFSYGIPTTAQVRVMVRYLRERGWKRIATLFATDAGGQDGERVFDGVLSLPENAGINVVAREHFNNTDVSVSAQIVRVRAAGAQAMIAWATGTPLGTVLHAASDLGFDIPTAVAASNLNYAEMRQFREILPKELYLVAVPGLAPLALPKGPLKVAAMTFDNATRAAGIKPDGNIAIGWDPAAIAIGALRTLGPGASAVQLHEYLENLHDFYGAAGAYDFRDGSQRGLDGRTAVVVRYDPIRELFGAVSAPR